jgi:hypothetical protein
LDVTEPRFTNIFPAVPARDDCRSAHDALLPHCCAQRRAAARLAIIVEAFCRLSFVRARRRAPG